MNLWCASVAFADPENPRFEKGWTIHYAASDRDEAVKAAHRWADGRHEVLPCTFGQVYCVKVYAFNPQPISENGGLLPANGFPVYEWKAF